MKQNDWSVQETEHYPDSRDHTVCLKLWITDNVVNNVQFLAQTNRFAS